MTTKTKFAAAFVLAATLVSATPVTPGDPARGARNQETVERQSGSAKVVTFQRGPQNDGKGGKGR